MKRKYRKFRRWFHRYINGTKGVISIMLALMMTPLLSVSLILVESARYQSAVEELEEVFDSAALSTLANYDSYLEERFGVLSTDQKASIKDINAEYIEKNKNLLGSNVTIDSVDSYGDFALGDIAVLKQQLLEYSEIMVPAQALMDNLDVEDLLAKIMKPLDDAINGMNKEIQYADAVVSMAGDMEDFLTDVVEAVKKFVELEKKQEEYIAAGNAFTDAAYNVVIAIKTAEEEQKKEEEEAQKKAEEEQKNTEEGSAEEETTEEETTAPETKAPVDIYQTEGVKNAIRDAENKRDDYKNKIDSFSSELKSFSGNINGIIGAAETLSDDIDEVKQAMNEKDDIEEDNNTFWLMEKVSVVGKLINETIGDNYEDLVNSDVRKLNDLKGIVAAFQGKKMTSSVTKEEIVSTYGPISVNSYSKFEKLSSALIAELCGNQSEEEKTNFLSVISGMVDLFDNLLSLNLLYDPALCALVPDGSLYDKDVAAEAYGTALMMSINNLSSAAHNIYEVFSHESLSADAKWYEKIAQPVIDFFVKAIKIVKAIKELFLAVSEFLAAVILYAANWAKGIMTLAANPTELANDFLLAGYAAYNMPCRINYSSGESLSGYKYSKIFKDLAGGSTTHALSGNLKEWKDSGSLSSPHDLFYGAELEYIAVGTKDEISNQASSFLAIYVFRLLVDFKQVTGNSWILMEEALGNAMTMGTAGTVFKYLMVLVEPLLDTVLLVNGGNSYLLKNVIYVEPAGIAFLVRDIINLTGIPTPIKGKLSSSAEEIERLQKRLTSSPVPKENVLGKIKLTYVETMMYLCLFTVDQDTLLKRIQNIIQMEAKYNYRNEHEFDLRKSYTYIRSEVNGKLNPMLKFDRLGANGPFPIQRVQYTGY